MDLSELSKSTQITLQMFLANNKAEDASRLNRIRKNDYETVIVFLSVDKANFEIRSEFPLRRVYTHPSKSNYSVCPFKRNALWEQPVT